ncbi:hypothetical protein AURDEDRAFT_156382 [Auricularia subglabra TFB-10046 SS5]|nr:hypothetical protein AURDEDRAFT_156382 [Auricularia subglabra TFB-10046 SS5]
MHDAGTLPDAVGLRQLTAVLYNLETIRFVAVATVTAHIYNTFLHLDEEIDYARKTAWSLAKVMYLLDQYVSMGIMLLLLHVTSGFASSESLTDERERLLLYLIQKPSCHRFIISLVIVAALGSIAAGNYIVLSYVWGLWDNAVWVKRGTLLVLFISYGAMVPMVVLRLVQSLHLMHAHHFGVHNFCLIQGRPPINRVYWLPPLMVDITSLVLFLLNAGHRPRRASSSLMRIIYRQGVFFFISMLAIHGVNCAVSNSASTAVFIPGTILCWGINIILLRKLVLSQARAADWKQPVFDLPDTPHTKGDFVAAISARSLVVSHDGEIATLADSLSLRPMPSKLAAGAEHPHALYNDKILYREWRREE